MLRLACIGTLGLLASSAGAQTALGDGRGLENRQIEATPTRRVNPQEAFLRQIRLRNAVVTGNAPGGLSFRGDVGYVAPGEFFGNLGSDDTFSFRRDSLLSGLMGAGIRGTEAIQYQFALTTGSNPPAGLLGAPIVERFGTPRPATQAVPIFKPPQLAETELTPPDPVEREIEDLLSPAGTLLGTLRSPSAYISTRASTPTVLGLSQTDEGKLWGMVASPLEGVRYQELQVPGYPSSEQGTQTPPSTDLRIEPTRSVYDDLVERLSALRIDTEEGEKVEPQRPAWEIRLDEIRKQLDEMNPDEDEGVEGPALPGQGLAQDAIDIIRGAGGEASSLIRGGDPRYDPFADHMRQAEALLSEGRYFDAEERYTRALGVRPGDVAAQIGRVHAQLGAGMYLSASVNLRQLLRKHPEIASMRYAQTLLPKPERLTSITRSLRQNMAGGTSTLARESALLLSYLGYQLGDRDLVAQGLDAFEKDASSADQRLAALLRGVWLSDRPEKPGG